MGAQHKKLGVPGEEQLSGRGVSYCATCDAAFFKEHETDHRRRRRLGDGGGDLPREVRLQGDVVHRRDEFRASTIMLDRARAVENIELLTPYVVEEFAAGEDGALALARAAQHRDRRDARARRRRAPSSRSGTSRSPSSSRGHVDTDDEGYVIDRGPSTRTNLPGVFAAGDLVDHTYRQAVTAAGSGCQAALDAEWYLRDTPAGRRRPRACPSGDLAEAQ